MIEREVLSNKKKRGKKNLYIIWGNKETLPVTISSDLMNHTTNDLCGKININLCNAKCYEQRPFLLLASLIKIND